MLQNVLDSQAPAGPSGELTVLLRPLPGLWEKTRMGGNGTEREGLKGDRKGGERGE